MNQQMVLRDELNYLESFHEVTITEDVIDKLLKIRKLLKVPMFIETLKNYLTKGEVTITKSTFGKYRDLHVVDHPVNGLMAYVYKKPLSEKVNKYKSSSDVFYDYFDKGSLL